MIPDSESLPGVLSSNATGLESPVIVSSHKSLSEAVLERKSEYIKRRKLKIKVGTWNVAALNGTEKDLGEWFLGNKGALGKSSAIRLKDNETQTPQRAERVESVESQEDRSSKREPTVPINDPGVSIGREGIDIYVLGLQEIVDISSPTETLRPYLDPNPARKWKHAVAEKLPQGYHQVAEQQLIGLYLLIYASSEVMPTISSVSTTNVGTGLMGYMGNKGSVAARIVLGEVTSMVFINCHLSAGAEKGSLERRNWDASQIQHRTTFEPIRSDEGAVEDPRDHIGDEDFAFWFGDLNYRLEDMPPEDVRRLLMLHTRNEYKISAPQRQKMETEIAFSESAQQENASSREDHDPSNQKATESIPTSASNGTLSDSLESQQDVALDSSSDPTSLQTTLSSLLVHDQLQHQMHSRKAFHDGWREGPIKFLPTYKYDVGSVGVFDSSEKRRGPSWCDRILYRTRQDKQESDRIKWELEQVKKKDEELRQRGVVDAAKDEAVLFDYDPETDGAGDADSETVAGPESAGIEASHDDRLTLEHYTSYQRVLSSDHKPLDAVFTVDYDAVDAELRAKVHQEVARELDKAENEGRPTVTIVVDRQYEKGSTQGEQASSFEGVDFGDVKYDQIYHRTATIANTGRVPAVVGFADRSVDDGQQGGIAPSWLSIHFDPPSELSSSKISASEELTIEPGDALNIELYLKVDDFHLVRQLNIKEQSLEDVLVLRIQNGRDYFLQIRASWLPSVFGRTIEDLINVPDGGIRNLRAQAQDSSSRGTDNVKRSAPRELFQLTESIENYIEKAIGEWEMTGENRSKLAVDMAGWPFTASTESEEQFLLRECVRDALDCDISFEEAWPSGTTSVQKIESVGQTLVLFLQSLEDGVITTSLWNELEKGLLEHEKSKHTFSAEEQRTWILDVLSSSPTHSVSFTFVTFALSRVANEVTPLRSTAPTSPSQAFQDAFHEQIRIHDEAGKRRKQLETAYASIFADAMIRLPSFPSGTKAKKATDARKRRIVEVFLSGYS